MASTESTPCERTSERTNPHPGIRIGEVAERSGLSVKTIRFYCDQGLIKPLTRSDGGFRLFAEPVIAELVVIRTLKNIGMPLSQIKNLLEVRRSGICNCDILKTSLANKVDTIDKSIAELLQMQQELRRMLQSWQDCGGTKTMQPHPDA